MSHYGSSTNVSFLRQRNTARAVDDIPEREVPTSVSRRAKQHHQEPFVRGPIPTRLIRAVWALPGRPVMVLWAIYYRLALTGDPWVTLPERVMAEFVFDRATKSRALAEMERAGLIQVKRTPGRPMRVALAGEWAAPALGGVHDDE
jgi:hypothetical protein